MDRPRTRWQRVHRRPTQQAIQKTFPAALRGHRREHSFGLPGLGKHKGSLSFFVQLPCERRGHSCWTPPIHTERFVATDSTILVLHDTTEFSYHRENISSVGILHRLTRWDEKAGLQRDAIRSQC